ncbi:MAG: cyclase family protein [Gammaproteobacteria bacterium]
MSTGLFSDYNLIDLTHTLNSSAPTWSGNCGFNHKVIVDYPEACRVQSIDMNAGTGTHIDAPSHFIPGAKSAADIPLDDLIVPVYVIDVSARAHADYYITPDDIYAFEKQHGKISAKSLVVGYTGWDQYWHDAKKFRNPDDTGQMHFPGFSKNSAELLLERGIAGLGIDSLSPDCLDLNFPVHYAILGAGKYIVENLAHCKLLPPVGAYTIILPIKTQDGTEAVARAIGLTPKL